MTDQRDELLRLCDDTIETWVRGEEVHHAHETEVTLARALKELLTRPEAQGETPLADAFERKIASIFYERLGAFPVGALADAFQEVKRMERELSAKREGFVWVPVSEGLPEHIYPQAHVVWNAKDGIDITTVHPSWWNRPDPRGPEYHGPNVTHWMPLPEPPTAATKEGP